MRAKGEAMSETCTCDGIVPSDTHDVSCPASLYQAGIQRGRAEVVALVVAVWPIENDCGPGVPECRYCHTQRSTPDGHEFAHKETCAWLRLKNAISAA